MVAFCRQQGRPLLDFLVAASLPIFTVGILLIMAALVLQLVELQKSNRTLLLDTQDIVRPEKVQPVKAQRQ